MEAVLLDRHLRENAHRVEKMRLFAMIFDGEYMREVGF